MSYSVVQGLRAWEASKETCAVCRFLLVPDGQNRAGFDKWMTRKGKWPIVWIIVGILNKLLIAAQAVKLLDLPRFPPAKSIQSKLNGGRNGNMLKIGGILPTHVTRLKRKSARRIRLQNTRQSERKRKRKSAGNHGKALKVSLSEDPENKTSLSLPF